MTIKHIIPDYDYGDGVDGARTITVIRTGDWMTQKGLTDRRPLQKRSETQGGVPRDDGFRGACHRAALCADPLAQSTLRADPDFEFNASKTSAPRPRGSRGAGNQGLYQGPSISTCPPSSPGLTRRSISFERLCVFRWMRGIGERSDAVLRTAMPAHDESETVALGISRSIGMKLKECDRYRSCQKSNPANSPRSIRKKTWRLAYLEPLS